MSKVNWMPAVAAALLCCATPAFSQQPGADFPEGPGKAVVVAVCNGCHDINRIRAGYTPAGWNMLQHMMQNMGAPVEPEDWPTVVTYLTKNFPERPRPPAAQITGPAQASITLWDVPTIGSRPHDPLATSDGAIWWTGQLANKLGRLDPKTGAIREYTLKTPHTAPHGLTEDSDGNIWFTGNNIGIIGMLDPKTGVTTEYPLPDSQARDTHTLVFDHDGILWFTVQQANRVGRLDPKTGEIKLVTPPTPKARPYGMAVNSKNVVYFVEFGANKIATIDQRHADQGIHAARPRRASAPHRDRAGRHGLVHRFRARLSRQARSFLRHGEGVAVAKRPEIGALRHRFHQRRALVRRDLRQAECRRAFRSGDGEIPDLGDPRRR